MSWLTTDNEAAFAPFRDYLGLLDLVSRAPSSSTRSSKSEDIEDLDDFKSNGVDCGLMPFTVPPVEESPWGESGGGPVLRATTPTRSRSWSHPRRQLVTWCVFCRNNGESQDVYASHLLKDEQGRTTCPILRAYACPICGAKGDGAHTIKYCPSSRRVGEEVPAPLKTPRTSTGIRKSHVASTVTMRAQSNGAVGAWSWNGRH